MKSMTKPVLQSATLEVHVNAKGICFYCWKVGSLWPLTNEVIKIVTSGGAILVIWGCNTSNMFICIVFETIFAFDRWTVRLYFRIAA